MKSNTNAFVLVCTLMLLLFSSCAAVAQKKKKNEPVEDSKDKVSVFKPLYPASNGSSAVIQSNDTNRVNNTDFVPKNDVTAALQEKLDTLYRYNEKIVSADGYRILVYNGTSSEEARDMRGKLYEMNPKEKVYTEWKSPNFKVKVGNFLDKLEAYYTLNFIQKQIPNAIIIPDKISIVRE